ncbi:MAG: S49 family peptidase [Prevotellaceae bacterium]|jgi:protease-4|nr:S49 family peptidase [Prevotellaceae bacterium]
MTSSLHSNWQFLLANALMRGQWFIAPQYVAAHSELIANMLNKQSPFSVEQPLLSNRPDYVMQAGNGQVIWGIRKNFSEIPKNSVAIFPLKGTMMKDGTWCSYGTEEIEMFMQAAAAQPNVVGMVLHIDSPGGEVGSIAPIHRGIDYFAKQGKPVVSVCDYCYSAGYYAAIKTDLILAENDISSDFGSIGTMLDFIDSMPILEKAGYVHHRIKADESSDKNTAFEQALKGDYTAIKTEMLSPLAQKFQADVKAARGARLKADTPGILNGKTFFAKDALAVGLIDDFGDLNKAVQLVLELA